MVTPATLALASPWAPTNHLAQVLEGVVLSDMFGAIDVRPVTRAEAMTVPAVARARHIIAGTVARIPMRGYRAGVALEGAAAPAWINSTAGVLSAYHRALWTADDLLFNGWSCWSRVNGWDTFPLTMDRVPMGRWSVDKAGRVLVANAEGDHELVDQSTVCLIPGPHEGILTSCATTIRHAADLQRQAATAARHPSAYLALRQTAGTPIKYDSTDPEEVTVTSTIRDWHAAREGGNGGVAFIPMGLEAQELGTFDVHLVTEGRNAAAVDVARVCSLPADLLDANAAGASLTYSTTRDNDLRAIQYGVGLYLSSLSAHLSLDAVTPRGQEVRFDIESWLEDPVSDAGTAPAAPPAPPVVSRETSPPALAVVPPTQKASA
jgi:hypothetical protein